MTKSFTQFDLNRLNDQVEIDNFQSVSIEHIGNLIAKAISVNALDGHLTKCFRFLASSEKLNSSQIEVRAIARSYAMSLNFVSDHALEEAKSDDAKELATIFQGLVKKWKDETRWTSMMARRYAHPSYQSILVLGGKESDVVRLILEEMKTSPDMWFEALRRLTNTSDDPAKNSKSFEDSTNAWLAWGRKNKIIS